LKPESGAKRFAAVATATGTFMTDHELHRESERVIDEALREIEAIKVALEASRAKATHADMTLSSHDPKDARTN
jgi:hypothetical protein